MTDKLNKALKEHFRLSGFRSGQKETIESVLNKRDTLVIMPTGGGKSLCYQLPALMLEGTALVFSPLVALMKDQVDALEKQNIPATFINSTLSYDEINERTNKALNGDYKLLYLAPERLESNRFLRILDSIKTSFVAVDEAHCISEWGHDFRPAYLTIIKHFDYDKRPPIIALTATATPEVQKDIAMVLKLNKPNVIIRGFDRPNLSYNTLETPDKTSKIISLLNKTKQGSSIIYCGSRKRTEMFTSELKSAGINAQAYHAGFPDNFRKFVQEGFFSGKFNIIVATNAFGLGIDKPDVRNLIHVDFTQTLESYYQEAGRAGRDGKSSECWLLYQRTDRRLMDFFIQSTYPDKSDVLKVYNALYDFASVQMGEKPMAPVFVDEAALANNTGVPVYTASSVISLLERHDVLMRGSTEGLSMIQFTTSRERIMNFLENTQGSKRDVAEALLRSMNSDAFYRLSEIDLNHVAMKYHFKPDELLKAIQSFQFARMLNFVPSGTPKGIIIKSERMPDSRIPVNFEEIETRRERAYQKFSVVLRYASSSECKRNFILSYFKESDIKGFCGKCSSCNNDAFQSEVKTDNSVQKAILEAVSEINGRFGKTILLDILLGKKSKKALQYKFSELPSFGSCKNIAPSHLNSELDECLAKGLIAYSSDIYPTIHLTKFSTLSGKAKVRTDDFNRQKEEEKFSKALFEELKSLRDEIASMEGIVARAVIGERALKLIAQKLPATKSALKEIEGVNSYFIARYSATFLERINKHKTGAIAETIPEDPLLTKLIESVKRTKKLSEASKEAGIDEAVASKLIQEAVEKNAGIDKSIFVDDVILAKIKDYLISKPYVVMRELKQDLSLTLDYPTLRIAIAFARQELKSGK